MLNCPHGGMLKFKYKGQSLTIKKSCKELFDLESERWDHALVPLLHAQITKLEKK